MVYRKNTERFSKFKCARSNLFRHLQRFHMYFSCSLAQLLYFIGATLIFLYVHVHILTFFLVVHHKLSDSAPCFLFMLLLIWNRYVKANRLNRTAENILNFSCLQQHQPPLTNALFIMSHKKL